MNPYAKALSKRDPLKVLAATPGQIQKMIGKLSPRQLTKRPAPDKWSIQQILSHLAETEMVMGCRSRWIAFEENPTLVPFDQDKWALGWERGKEPLGETLERFRLLRRSHIRLLRGASQKDLQRAGFHPERGKVTLKEQMETVAGHDLNHLDQIQRLAEAWKPARR